TQRQATIPFDFPLSFFGDSKLRLDVRCAQTGTLQPPSGPSTVYTLHWDSFRFLGSRFGWSQSDIDSWNAQLELLNPPATTFWVSDVGVQGVALRHVSPAFEEWFQALAPRIMAEVERNLTRSLPLRDWTSLCTQALPSGR